MTQAEAGDPLAAEYGDSPLIASQARTDRVWTRVNELTPALAGQKVIAGLGVGLDPVGEECVT